MPSRPFVLIRGGGDLGSGVALRLFRAGFPVLITELTQPLCVRRQVCFSEAVVAGSFTVEGVQADLCPDTDAVRDAFNRDRLAVIVDPEARTGMKLNPTVWVDARMMKQPPDTALDIAPLVIGLGPGFQAGIHSHAVVETNRGPHLGRVFWQGSTEADTGMPESVRDYRVERVLRSPVDGILELQKQIGEQVREGETICLVNGQLVIAPFQGVLRGILRDGQRVAAGLKIGDLDPRGDVSLCTLVSDKALAVGGGVLEAILTRPDVRAAFFNSRAR